MSETKRPQTGKKLLAALMLGVAVLCPPSYSLALPNQGSYDNTKAAKITITNNDKVMNIVGKSMNNVLNWQTFDIGEKETVRFDNGAFRRNYLNLIHDNGMSLIFGKIEGGKNVYLINPNGFLFGVDSQINVGNLYVSTRPLDSIDEKAFSANGKLTPLTDKNNLRGDILDFGITKADTVQFEGNDIILFSRNDIISQKEPTLTARNEVFIVEDYIPDDDDDKEKKKTSSEQQIAPETKVKLKEAKEQEKAVQDKLVSVLTQISAQRKNDDERTSTLFFISQSKDGQGDIGPNGEKRGYGGDPNPEEERKCAALLAIILEQDTARSILLQSYEQKVKNIQNKYKNERQQLFRSSQAETIDFIRQEQNKLSEQKNNSLGMGGRVKEDLNAFLKTKPLDDLNKINERTKLALKEKAELEKLSAEMAEIRLEQIRNHNAEIKRFSKNNGYGSIGTPFFRKILDNIDSKNIKALTAASKK